MTLGNDIDSKIRLAAFDWLAKQTKLHGDVLPRHLLQTGFPFGDTRISLISPQGIFKPLILPEIPLSITTAPKGSYNDSFSPDGLLLYRYRGTDPHHRDNEGLWMDGISLMATISTAKFGLLVKNVQCSKLKNTEKPQP